VCAFVLFIATTRIAFGGFLLNNNKKHRKLAQGAYKFLWHEGQTPFHHRSRSPRAVVQVKNILCRPPTPLFWPKTNVMKETII